MGINCLPEVNVSCRECSRRQMALTMAPHVTVTLVGLLGNGVMLSVICRYELLRTLANSFIVNVTICDTVVCGLYLICAVISTGAPYIVQHPLYCVVLGYLSNLLLLTSVTSLLALCYDRFFFVTKPLYYNYRMTKRIAGMCFVYTWCQGILLAIFPLLGWGKYVPVRHTGFCDVDWSGGDAVYSVVLLLLGFFVPLAAVIALSAALVMKVRVRHRKVQVRAPFKYITTPGPILNSAGMRAVNLAYLKTAKILSSLVIVFFVCCTPYLIVVVLKLLSTPCVEKIGTNFVVTFFLVVKSAMNPWLYGLYNRQFRRTLGSIFPCYNKCWQNSSADLKPYGNGKTVSLLVLDEIKAPMHQQYGGLHRGQSQRDLNFDGIELEIQTAWDI